MMKIVGYTLEIEYHFRYRHNNEEWKNFFHKVKHNKKIYLNHKSAQEAGEQMLKQYAISYKIITLYVEE